MTLTDQRLHYTWKNRQRWSSAKPVGPIAQEIISKAKCGCGPVLAGLCHSWSLVVPDALQGTSWPVRLHSGVLTVKVQSSAVRFELEQFGQGRLLELLRGMPPERQIKRIQWVVGY